MYKTQPPVQIPPQAVPSADLPTTKYRFDTRLFDTAEILPSHRTQPLSVAFWLEPAISDFRGAFIVSRTVGVPMVSTLYGSRHQNYYTTLKTLGI